MSRKAKRGRILLYGDVEFHFAGGRDDDCLFLVFRKVKIGDEIVPDISVKFGVS